jgi:hypothetical protein
MSINDACRFVISNKNIVPYLKNQQNSASLWNAFSHIMTDSWKSLDISSPTSRMAVCANIFDQQYKDLLTKMHNICVNLPLGDVMRIMKYMHEDFNLGQTFAQYMKTDFPLTNVSIDQDVKDFIAGKETPIYNQSYNGSDAQKEAVSLYMSSVQMSNPCCEARMHKFADCRHRGDGKRKAAAIGYIFSSGHPTLIMTFIDHLINSLNQKVMCGDKLYEVGAEHLSTGFHAEYNGTGNPENIYRGIWLDFNCKKWHGGRAVVTLFELLEIYKWATSGGEFIHWLSPRERRDGHFAFKAFMDTSIWRKRKTPGPPNEYAAMVRSLI